MKKVNMFIFLLIGMVILNFTSSFGQVKLSLEDYFVKNADLIMTGEVKNMKAKWDESKKNIFTYVTVHCLNWYKGEKVKKITIKVFGGAVGDVGMDISTAETYKLNEKIFAFLKKNNDGTYSVVAARDGKYTYKGDNLVSEFTGEVFNKSFINTVKSIVEKQRTTLK